MLATTMMMGACTSDDSWDDSWYGDDTSAEETTTSAYSEMKTFTIATDKTTAEPVSTVAATYPEDGDAPSAQTFTTTVNIDMTSPADPGVSGVSVTINGNDITVDHGSTENHNYTGNTDNLPAAYTSSPKGMKIGNKEEDGTTTTTYGILKISGGDIMVRTSGNNAEGIESKGTLDITGGSVLVYAHDDAINSTGDMTISGGTVVAVGTNNDAIDANGNMYLKGGTIIACGASGAETGIDVNEQKKLYITGGNIFSIGGHTDANLGSTTQGIISTTGSTTANGTVTISNGSTLLFTFNMPPISYSNGTMMISTPNLTSGNSYTLTAGGYTQTVTASNTINSAMGGGGAPGGGFPGGGPGGW